MASVLDTFLGRTTPATPATRAEAEEALRSTTAGDTSNDTPTETVSDAATVESATVGETEGKVESENPFDRVNIAEVFEAVAAKAKQVGVEPGTPEFDKLLKDTVQSALGENVEVNVTFLGKVEDGALGAGNPFDDIFGSPEFGGPFGYAPKFGSPFDSIGVDRPDLLGGLNPFSGERLSSDECLFCKMVRAMREQIEEREAFERERREVVQDLSAAAADVGDLFYNDEVAGSNFAASLRNISQLASQAYGD